LTPQLTFTVLLIVQALHLLHHRLAKRHISFAEVLSALVLCIPLTAMAPAFLMVMHLGLASVQVVGSMWIRRLSPDWSQGGGVLARLG
jgi:hypothetical protein